MELKALSRYIMELSFKVLIVPCGIERVFNQARLQYLQRVLIVPCGIEREILRAQFYRPTDVLIVPCGIERELAVSRMVLLQCVNCTLWN